MFKNKHQFSCPDVIYLMDRQKKLNRVAIAMNVIFFGGLFAAAKIEDKKLDREIRDLAETPVPTE